MKSILTYLRRTKDLFLIYGEEELKLKGYSDSSFQSDLDDTIFNLHLDSCSL